MLRDRVTQPTMLMVLLALGLASSSAERRGVEAAGVQQPKPVTRPSPPSLRSVLDTYCVTCHNEKLKTAGLMLDQTDVTNLAAGAVTWEKVIRKLRSGAMPPAGRPRPSKDVYDAVARTLETALDRAAAANPNPGRLPLLHRLSRTEYENAIRDLLDLEALPKEMDLSLLLPADNSSSGFDNIADLLFISPTTLEGYLEAAQKVSRLAIGDPTIPLIVDTHLVPTDMRQDVQLGGLPFGTRGGAVVKTYLPLDGEYGIKVEFAGVTRQPHELEISVDGERLQLFTIAQKPAKPEGQDAAAPGALAPAQDKAPQDQDKAIPDDKAAPDKTAPDKTAPDKDASKIIDKDLETRLTLRAGPRTIGVAFVQHSEARDETLLEPSLRSRGPLPGVARITVSGPFKGNVPQDTPSRRRVFVCRPSSHAEEDACARRILGTLTTRAFRRPVTDADLRDVLPFYSAGLEEGGFERGIQRGIERMLVSPQFLFRIERIQASAPPAKPFRITTLELASRLSFFLWSSVPDDELIRVAASGKLSDPLVLARQVTRMLADPRAESMVTNFAAQWLYLRDVEIKRPDDLLFPEFDESVRQAFRRETELFLDSIMRENRSVLEMLTANYTFVNERLAKHYGIPNVKGAYFRRYTFDKDSVRGGLLGQGSILTLTSYSTRTSPVLRGKWILENMLAAPPPPPPPNVPTLRTENNTGKALSMREAMEQHRANPVCASCNARMDPLGFALDNFDAVGKWRNLAESGGPIDASGTLDGVKFEGAAGLRALLLSHPEEFVRSVTEKLLKYAVGRDLEYYDAPAIRAIVRGSARTNYAFTSLIMGIVQSTPFQMRSPDESSRSN